MDVRRQTTVYAELIDPAGGRIDGDAWAAAHVGREPVARCRCGGEVYTDPTRPHYEAWRQRWYPMACESCGHETEVRGTQVFSGPRLSRALLAEHAAVERRRLAGA